MVGFCAEVEDFGDAKIPARWAAEEKVWFEQLRPIHLCVPHTNPNRAPFNSISDVLDVFLFLTKL